MNNILAPTASGAALIVTYNPEHEIVETLISHLQSQVKSIILVDNSELSLPDSITSKIDKYIFLNDNKGIAFAQNIGFFEAYKLGCDYVVTFDQDSKVTTDFIDVLKNNFIEASKITQNIAAIGPTVINERNNEIYEKYFKGSTDLGNGFYSVRSIISSGSLIPIQSLINIGLNKAEWFIDSIDTEWCYRARTLGYHICMTKNLTITHNLGLTDKKIIFNTTLTMGADIRLYYIFRNWIFSLKSESFPMWYKLKLLIMIPIKFTLFTYYTFKKERVIYMLRGLKDGILNKYGKYK